MQAFNYFLVSEQTLILLSSYQTKVIEILIPSDILKNGRVYLLSKYPFLACTDNKINVGHIGPVRDIARFLHVASNWI